jgi:hypothetical protein
MKFFTTTTLVISISLIGIGLTQKVKINRNIRKILNIDDDSEFDCEAYEKNQYSSSLNNFLKDYILVSEKEGVKASADLKSLRRKIKAGQLIEAPANKSFILDTFQFSYAVLTPYSKNLLDTIGIRFEKELKKTPLEGTKLIVTSMTRTLYTVSKLVKNNRTAVKRSPHLNGNSFDFSFSRFSTPRAIDNCELTFLQETISKILLDLKNEKRCWVTFERWEECLHVVAKK